MSNGKVVSVLSLIHQVSNRQQQDAAAVAVTAARGPSHHVHAVGQRIAQKAHCKCICQTETGRASKWGGTGEAVFASLLQAASSLL